MRRGHVVMLGSTSMLVFNGSGSDSEVVCASNDVGEVCAESNGEVTFSGDGLSRAPKLR